jgi:hypothetical protein
VPHELLGGEEIALLMAQTENTIAENERNAASVSPKTARQTFKIR